MTKGANKLGWVQSNDEDFDRLCGLVSFNKMPGDAGYSARRQFHVKKDPKTSIAHLLPARGRPSVHQPVKSVCGSILKKTTWDAEKQKENGDLVYGD